MTPWVWLAAAATLAAAPVDSPDARPPTSEASCGVAGVFDGQMKVLPLPGFKVLEGPDVLPIQVQEGAQVKALMCNRDSILPVTRDRRVIEQLKIPLYLTSKDRVVVLESTGGGWRLRLLDGPPFTDQERAAVVAQLEVFEGRAPPTR